VVELWAKYPTGQYVHEEALTPDTWLNAHAEHVEEAGPLKLPAGQLWQTELWGPLNVPAGQGRQKSPEGEENKPAGQTEQLVFAEPGAAKPDGQGRHGRLPKLLFCVPAVIQPTDTHQH
jgi:hypothetical protein